MRSENIAFSSLIDRKFRRFPPARPPGRTQHIASQPAREKGAILASTSVPLRQPECVPGSSHPRPSPPGTPASITPTIYMSGLFGMATSRPANCGTTSAVCSVPGFFGSPTTPPVGPDSFTSPKKVSLALSILFWDTFRIGPMRYRVQSMS